MDSLKILEFLHVENGDGSGSGYGYGYGYGYGDGSGSGFGSGSGSGYGDGSGYGSGSGSGDGYGSGSGDGYGSGSGIKAIGDKLVHLIDDVYTIVDQVHGNVAKGSILNADLTLTPCYIVKGSKTFAHGDTLQAAQSALMDKLFEDMDVDERVELFLKEFDLVNKYPVSRFFDWHNKLTGSCEMGRKQFARDHSIDLENGQMTVLEFVTLTKNAYGGDIIRAVSDRITSN